MDTPWLIADPEPYDEYDLGSVKTGKEAEVFLVERVGGGRPLVSAGAQALPPSDGHTQG